MTKIQGGLPVNRIGFSSCCFPVHMAIEDILQFCLNHEFRAFEIEVNRTNFDPNLVSVSTLRWIRDLSCSGTIDFGMHSPGNINLSDPDPTLMAKSEKEVIDTLELASRLEVETVVVHPGRVIGEFSPEKWQIALKNNILALKRCAARGRELGVNLSVENLCHEKGSVNPNILYFLEMCQAVDLSLIGIVLDTNHAGLVDGLDKSVETVGNYVNHIHFSSNKGIKSDHCEPGVGVMNFHVFGGFLRGFTGLNIIELNDTGTESAGAILRTRDFIEGLLSTVESK
jgi:sugar phosphate isomerase/epimerase